MGSCGTFVLLRLGSITFKLFAAIDLYSVNCGHMALYRSAGCTAEFKNIGRNVVVASKSGPVKTGPTILVVATLHSLWVPLQRRVPVKYLYHYSQEHMVVCSLATAKGVHTSGGKL